MTDLGWSHGPAQLVPVPEDAVVIQDVDQANVITASFSHPTGPEIAEVLRTELPRAGWTVTADTNDSLLFERPGWQGAYTVSPTVAALTVRADA